MDKLKALRLWAANEKSMAINHFAIAAFKDTIRQIDLLMLEPCIRCGKKTLPDSLHTCTPLPGSMDSEDHHHE